MYFLDKSFAHTISYGYTTSLPATTTAYTVSCSSQNASVSSAGMLNLPLHHLMDSGCCCRRDTQVRRGWRQRAFLLTCLQVIQRSACVR